MGSVRTPAGVPDAVFANVNTLLYQDGQVIGATLANPYSFSGVIANRDFELRASEVGGDHRAVRPRPPRRGGAGGDGRPPHGAARRHHRDGAGQLRLRRSRAPR